MKKTIIILAAFMLGIHTYAQDETVTPVGSFTIDINFDPAAIFDAGAGSMFYMPYLQGRYFIASDMAVRLGFQVDLESDKEYIDTDGEDFTRTSMTDVLLAPGIEKHFGSNRFFFYLGGEMPFNLYSTKSVTEVGGDSFETNNGDGGFFSIGLDAVIGANYYILPSFYIGAEFSPGFYFVNYADTEVDGDVTEKGGTATGFDLTSGSGIRLGVRF